MSVDSKYLLMALLTAFACLRAQDINTMEKQLTYAQTSLLFSTQRYDSLNTIYQTRIRDIDTEKRSASQDKTRIEKMMSAAVNYSNMLESLQSKIRKQQDDLTSLKEKLASAYGRIIDSLNNVKRNQSGETEKSTEEMLLRYMTKNLVLSPHLKLLSFNPEKLAEINLSKVSDKTQKKLFIDYITSAIGEINQLQTETGKAYNEVTGLIKLRKKISRFLEETDLSQSFGGKDQKFDNLDRANMRTPAVNNSIEFTKDGLSINVITYSSILSQLSYSLEPGSGSLPKNISINAGRISNLKEYQALLKELKQKLSDYKDLIQNKLNNGR